MKYKVLAVIGLRSGSKSIKNKNISLLLENPFYWILKQAKLSKYVDRILISTDSVKYQNLCKKYGAEVPFLRQNIRRQFRKIIYFTLLIG